VVCTIVVGLFVEGIWGVVDVVVGFGIDFVDVVVGFGIDFVDVVGFDFDVVDRR